ncbi:MAG: DUF805 domain-containing protein [Elusimicrobiota bacterium]|jgi:uncharacterized membrane protein YhaH (DUF805 family)|nr:DUF805 domain-containing protein [Elusimicrobiota bacterium]
MKFFDKYFFKILVNQYADFKSKASLKDFWLFGLYTFSCYLILYILSVAATGFPNLQIILSIITLTFFIATIIPTIAITTRRLHDSNRRGWWQLIVFVPALISISCFGILFEIIVAQYFAPDSQIAQLMQGAEFFDRVFKLSLIVLLCGILVLVVLLCQKSKAITKFDKLGKL